jgi:response regulator RpfG family c-di-GMP phosphodiesterase
LPADEVETIRLGAILHDVGKIGIPDRVLLKPAALDDDERRIVETHPLIGDKLLEPLELLAAARPIVRHHHERWDGKGYPDRLAGDAIPLGARIVAVADSIEVMSSRQLYRRPRTPEEIVSELHAHRSAQWDAQIVDLVLGLIDSGELQLCTDGLRLLERTAGEAVVAATAILLVEDDDEHARLVVETLERALGDAIVARARCAADAAELLNGSTWALAIVDRQLRDGHGLDVLDTLRAHDPSLPVVMLTGETSDELAVEAFRHGASDYVVKDSTDLGALARRVRGLVVA